MTTVEINMQAVSLAITGEALSIHPVISVSKGISLYRFGEDKLHILVDAAGGFTAMHDDGTGVRTVSTGHLSEYAGLSADATALLAVKAINETCTRLGDNGISAIGAAAAIQAMTFHWVDHLSQGESLSIIDADIIELFVQLEAFRLEIRTRITAIQG